MTPLGVVCFGAVELAALVTLSIDWYQTVIIQRIGHVESNRILGPHPGEALIAIYFALCIVVHLAVALALVLLTGAAPAMTWAAAVAVAESWQIGWNTARRKVAP